MPGAIDEGAALQSKALRVQTGGVIVKVSAEALRTDVLCDNEVAVVPAVVDTVIRTLLVEVSEH